MVLLDVHGWENKTIGNGEIGAYFGEQFGFGHIEKYPNGFLIAEGNAMGAKSTLVELPMPNSQSDINNRGFSQKISRAIQNIIKRNPGVFTNEVDSTKITEVDAKQGKVIKVTSHLNIRSGAGTNFDIVGKLKPNQIVDLYGQVNNWYKIYLGYVSKDFIEEIKETTKPASKPKAETTISKQGQVVKVTSHLNIRSGAGTNFDIVGKLKPNQIVDLYGETNKWYKIYLGYVHEDFIKELKNTDENHVKEESKKSIIEENKNQGEEVTIITITTNFLVGVGEGVYEDIKSLFDIHAIIESIKNIPDGVKFLAKATIEGTKENEIFNQVLENMINDFLDSNGNEKAKTIGKIVGKLVLAIIGTKGLDKGIDLIKLSAKSGKLSALASRIGKGKKLESVEEMLVEFGETGALPDGVCFTENTLIYTKDGYTPIKDIKIGDKVYSKNVYTNEVGLKEVKNTYVKEKSKLVYIKVANDIIETTEEHPFYVKDKGWIIAGNLTKDDKLVTDDKETSIDKIEIKALDKPVKVYNFEVEDWHNYFVSENKVLVHNSCSEIITEAGETAYDGVRIINKKYAGKVFEFSGDLAKKYPNGVKFNKAGFPDFSQYAKVKVEINGLTGKASDFTKANKTLGWSSKPNGYTWHHVEDGLTLILVPTDLHQAVRHTGGASLLKKGLVP